MKEKELVKKFSKDIEKITLERVNIILDVVRYRRHNPKEDCMCEVCRVIQEIKEEMRKVFINKKVGK